MIGISAYLFDPFGSRVFSTEANSTRTQNLERRVSRIKTLDGGVFVSDLGFSEGDSEFLIAVRMKEKKDYDFFQRLLKLYPRVTVSTPDGVFDCYVRGVTVQGNTASLMVLPMSKVSA